MSDEVKRYYDNPDLLMKDPNISDKELSRLRQLAITSFIKDKKQDTQEV